MGFYVKFVPYNENTIAGLINKTVKFSTVYEFNDFNELRYISDHSGNEEKAKEIINNELKKVGVRNSILENASQHAYDSTFLRKLKDNFENPSGFEINDDNIRFLIESIVFRSVGIFCVSHLQVFEYDGAQLMFAHYGDNSKGLALIYKIESEPQRVQYVDSDISKGSCGEAGFQQYYEGPFPEKPEDFLKKSQKWSYEDEYRMFRPPKIYTFDECKIELKAILYTARLSSDKKKTLQEINKKHYEDSLEIQEIFPCYSECRFRMLADNKLTFNWLKDKKFLPEKTMKKIDVTLSGRVAEKIIKLKGYSSYSDTVTDYLLQLKLFGENDVPDN